MDMKEEHSKTENIVYKDLRQQEYLKSSQVPTYKAQSLFKFRTRMNRVKSNFKQSYSDFTCPLCLISEDQDGHLLECTKIKEKSSAIRHNTSVKYKDIYSSSIEKMVAAVDLLEAAMKVRENLLEE